MYYSRVEYTKRYGVQSILLLSAAAGGAGGRRIQAERQLVCHMEKDGPEERGAFTLAHPCPEPPAPWGGWISGYTSHGSIPEARALSW